MTTEWEDIHVKLGNYTPTKEKDPTNAELEKIVIETAENYDPLKKKTMDELDELELSDDEDDFLKEYKAKRFAEIKEKASKLRYGRMAEIRKQDFIDQVTNAPMGVDVVLCLYNDSVEKSLLMCEYFGFLADKFKQVKFLKIEARNCIPNIKMADVPAVIIYRDGKLAHNFIPAKTRFSENFTLRKMEWVLAKLNIVETQLEEDPFETEVFKIYRPPKRKNSAESDEEQREDKQYAWKKQDFSKYNN